MSEVVAFAGTKLQRLLGRERVRACVHRPGLEGRKTFGV